MKYTLIDFAVSMDIPVSDAFVLPALFDRAADELDMTRDQLLAQIMQEPEAADYMKGRCEQIAREYRNANGNT